MTTAQVDAQRLARVIDLLRDETLSSLRVLDLACRVGVFSAGLGELGATVLGVEGRRENLAQAPAVAGVTYECADVRSVSKETHGVFDVTLCLGLLYHLDAASAHDLLFNVARMTRTLVIVDTHVDRDGRDTVEVAGHRYQGHLYQDFDTPWGSIGNSQSFWFTSASLLALMKAVGLANAEQLDTPDFTNGEGRAWFTAWGSAE